MHVAWADKFITNAQESPREWQGKMMRFQNVSRIDATIMLTFYCDIDHGGWAMFDTPKPEEQFQN